MQDERYKQIMSDLGMPDSNSLLSALKQVANEVAQEYTEKVSRLQFALADTEALELGTSERCGRLSAELLAAQAVIEQVTHALENIRLFAARHRNEEWAKTILRFCSEGGATGSALRSTEALRDRDRKRDATLIRMAYCFCREHNVPLECAAKARESGEWEPEL